MVQQTADGSYMVQVGILSWDLDCDLNFLNIYTDVQELKEWVDDQIHSPQEEDSSSSQEEDSSSSQEEDSSSSQEVNSSTSQEVDSSSSREED